MNILWELSPETSPKIPTCRRELKASRQSTHCKLSLWGTVYPIPFPASSPTGTHLLDCKSPHEICNQGSNGQANLLSLSPRFPLI